MSNVLCLSSMLLSRFCIDNETEEEGDKSELKEASVLPKDQEPKTDENTALNPEEMADLKK